LHARPDGHCAHAHAGMACAHSAASERGQCCVRARTPKNMSQQKSSQRDYLVFVCVVCVCVFTEQPREQAACLGFRVYGSDLRPCSLFNMVISCRARMQVTVAVHTSPSLPSAGDRPAAARGSAQRQRRCCQPEPLRRGDAREQRETREERRHSH
jgi:hypothetical protein